MFLLKRYMEVKQEPNERNETIEHKRYLYCHKAISQRGRGLALARYKSSGNNKRGVRNKSNSIRC